MLHWCVGFYDMPYLGLIWLSAKIQLEVPSVFAGFLKVHHFKGRHVNLQSNDFHEMQKVGRNKNWEHFSVNDLPSDVVSVLPEFSRSCVARKSCAHRCVPWCPAAGNFLTFAFVALLGERLSKANEFFLFAGGCAAATFLMIWNSHAYECSQSFIPAHPDPVLAEATYLSMNEWILCPL